MTDHADNFANYSKLIPDKKQEVALVMLSASRLISDLCCCLLKPAKLTVSVRFDHA